MKDCDDEYSVGGLWEDSALIGIPAQCGSQSIDRMLPKINQFTIISQMRLQIFSFEFSTLMFCTHKTPCDSSR